MKRLIVIVLFLTATATAVAQCPTGMFRQRSIRDSAGAIVAGECVNMAPPAGFYFPSLYVGTLYANTFNGVVSTANYPGDACAKIMAASAALPATGGIVDARSLPVGDTTCTSGTITLGTATKSVTLLMGYTRIISSFNPVVLIPGPSGIIGENPSGNNSGSYSGFASLHATGDTIKITGSFPYLVNIYALKTGTGGASLKLQASGTTSIQHGHFDNLLLSGGATGGATTFVGLDLIADSATALVSFNRFFQIYLTGCDTCLSQSTTGTQGPTDNEFYGVTALNFGGTFGTGISATAGALDKFSGGHIASMATGINVAAGVSFYSFVNFRLESNTANIVDNGTGTTFLAFSTGASTTSGTDATRTYIGVGNSGSTNQLPNVTIGGGTTITNHLSCTASLDYTALAANSCEVLTVTCTGAADGDTVDLGVPNALADVDGATERTVFFAWVSGAGVVSVRRCNVTAVATANPAAATVRVDVWKH